ncbi:MAG TPA: hypothetical protein VF698_13385, partial [Thermoanaerobaculia bacterium]
AERVWHFLRGTGRNAHHFGAARSFVVAAHPHEPGTMEGVRRVYCHDGWVELEKQPLRWRIVYALLTMRRRASR